MADLQSLKASLGTGNALTEEQKQKRQADLEAFQKREKERENERQQYYIGQRLATALKFSPPQRFRPQWIDVKDGQAIMEYGATFDNFNPTLQPKAFQAAKDFAEGTENKEGDGLLVPGLLLVGPVGVGKSHLASAIFNHAFGEWLNRKWKFSTRYITESKLLAAVKATFIRQPEESEEPEQSEDQVIAGFANCSRLILDDLCKYEVADPRFRNRVLFQVIDGLWAQGSNLMATSNYALVVLTEMLGEPIADRLRDMCVVVEMTGKSQRGKR